MPDLHAHIAGHVERLLDTANPLLVALFEGVVKDFEDALAAVPDESDAAENLSRALSLNERLEAEVRRLNAEVERLALVAVSPTVEIEENSVAEVRKEEADNREGFEPASRSHDSVHALEPGVGELESDPSREPDAHVPGLDGATTLGESLIDSPAVDLIARDGKSPQREFSADEEARMLSIWDRSGNVSDVQRRFKGSLADEIRSVLRKHGRKVPEPMPRDQRTALSIAARARRAQESAPAVYDFAILTAANKAKIEELHAKGMVPSQIQQRIGRKGVTTNIIRAYIEQHCKAPAETAPPAANPYEITSVERPIVHPRHYDAHKTCQAIQYVADGRDEEALIDLRMDAEGCAYILTKYANWIGDYRRLKAPYQRNEMRQNWLTALKSELGGAA